MSHTQVQNDLQVETGFQPADDSLDEDPREECEEPDDEQPEQPCTINGRDGKTYSARVHRYTDEEAAELLDRYDDATTAERSAIADELAGDAVGSTTSARITSGLSHGGRGGVVGMFVMSVPFGSLLHIRCTAAFLGPRS